MSFLIYVFAFERKPLPVEIQAARIHVQIGRGKSARGEVDRLILVERLVTVDVAALSRELRSVPTENIIQ